MVTFELYQSTTDKQYRWRMKSANGQIIAGGGEGYTTKAGAQNGIDAVKRDAASAAVKDLV